MDEYENTKEKELLDLIKRKQLCEKIIKLRIEEIVSIDNKIDDLCKEIYLP